MTNANVVRNRPGRARRGVAMAALAGTMCVSAAYGFLMSEYHVFPYRFLKHGEHELKSVARPASKHASKAPKGGMPQARHARLAVDAADRLMNLPYLRGYKAAGGTDGVRVNDPALAQPGWNFFISSHAPAAWLMDMNGHTIKSWKADMAKAFPDGGHGHAGHDEFLRDAELLPDGGVLVMFDHVGIVRLNSASQMLWAWQAGVHHDMVLDGAGHIWTLFHAKRVVSEIRPAPIQEDSIVEISPEGKPLRQISLVQCFLRSRYASVLGILWQKSGPDIFHTNSIVVLDGSLADRYPAFRRGNVLVSIRNIGVVAVIDPNAREVVWASSGFWLGQHSARLVAPGHLLLFDNLGSLREASRALEIDPFTQRVVWSYGGQDDQPLLSETLGFVQRLSNGNTLITESNYGRAIEVTPDDRVVWEYVNPNRIGKQKEYIATLGFMKRLDKDASFVRSPVAGSLSAPEASRQSSGP
jgi:arylsulfotransferase ASST